MFAQNPRFFVIFGHFPRIFDVFKRPLFFIYGSLEGLIVASAQKTVGKQRGIYLRLQQPMSSMYEFMLFNLLIKCMRPCQ